MRVLCILSFIALVSISAVVSQPLVKVECAGLPLYRGRVDTIVFPGAVGNHVHRVFGASNFGAGKPSDSVTDIFNSLRNSPCNTCSLKNVDNSAYWHPDLYYRWPNGSLSLVPQGGLTVYYEGRQGTGDQANPKYVAFPPGFRMIAGNPYRRSFNKSRVADTAISFACLAAQPNAETNGFPPANMHCINGLRMQVYFPQCWNGKDLDTPDHSSHVAYPDRYDNGNCPPGFPIRLMGVFFEAFYSVGDFPQQNYQPLVLACGDSTGYGFHGDFLNGWDHDILQSAILDPTCDAKSTNNGNNVRACGPLSKYVVDPSNGKCDLSKRIPMTEALGMVYPIPRLPGCQNITGEQAQNAPMCLSPPSASYMPPISQRFHLKSKSTGKYVTAPADNSLPILANVVASDPSLNEVFAPVPWASGNVKGVNLIPEYAYGLVNWCSTHGNNGAVICDRRATDNSATSWEAFQIVPQTGNWIAIKAVMNGKYLSVQGDGSLAPTATNVGDSELFQQLSPDGGHL